MKYPVPGIVKTRLARDIGGDAACEVYRTVAGRIIAETGADAADYERVIFYSPAGDKDRFGKWLPGEKLVAQRGGDIGEIMDNAFCDLFEAGAEKGILAGVDIPGLNKQIVNRAFRELERGDAVIGPALDGGYYLIGLKSRLPEIFHNMPWGTEKVFGETLRIMANLGLTVRTVRAMADVDTFEDFLRGKAIYPAYFRPV